MLILNHSEVSMPLRKHLST